jgi:hypothetical protein
MRVLQIRFKGSTPLTRTMKTCQKCKGSMKAFCKLDGSKYIIEQCDKCGGTFCDYCLIAGVTKFTNGKPKRKKFKPVCWECYKEYYD